MRSTRRSLITGAVLIASAVAFALAPAASVSATDVTPIVECVFHDTGTGQYTASFGYNNTSGPKTTFTYPIGTLNGFSPAPQNRGQPVTFTAGQHDNLFTGSWNGTGSLTWTLNGRSVSAATTSPACKTDPVPIVAPQTLLWLAVGAAGVGVVAWRRRRAVADIVRSPEPAV